jgi:hypothetical protein
MGVVRSAAFWQIGAASPTGKPGLGGDRSRRFERAAMGTAKLIGG